ncbi:M20 family metallopeptidase [Psychrobacillus sp. NEAU-3TGS]|uniref:M20 metallopeptidase family protein n=1 Tax=Psychrobacillus sp. NEAU-3TGS TaxID=2995412 RepID=UPI002497595B|nr:M20 family metallopeptidase [Psychrobacillus sp. NEAU-3TGS]MDI2587211.1 M20 family metallopeptidase [Psychrobacillus sp. NEAU-3TGS]
MKQSNTQIDPFERVKELSPKLVEMVDAIFDDMIVIRRDLRKFPELAFQEKRTSTIVASCLKEWGYEVTEGVGGTGVIGILRGEHPGPVIGLRADMDALPMPDEIDEIYRSVNSGIAHTCGHDVHTTNLLGVAKIISVMGLERGTLKLFFQPAEEVGAGAKAMIDDGALQNPPVDLMAGLHVAPSLQVGEFSITNSEFSCAAVDIFELEVTGKGGHAAHPHLAVDAVMITAQVLVALQQIVSRQIDPLDSVVLSIGQIQGGTKGTILPNTVKVNGTVRTMIPATREAMPIRIEQIASNVAAAFGGSVRLTYEKVTPSVQNDKSAKALLHDVVSELFGEDALKYTNPSMGGEDFAYFAQEVPSVFFRLGTNSGESTAHGIHTTKFNVDEEAIRYGMTVLSYLTYQYLLDEKRETK